MSPKPTPYTLKFFELHWQDQKMAFAQFQMGEMTDTSLIVLDSSFSGMDMVSFAIFGGQPMFLLQVRLFCC